MGNFKQQNSKESAHKFNETCKISKNSLRYICHNFLSRFHFFNRTFKKHTHTNFHKNSRCYVKLVNSHGAGFVTLSRLSRLDTKFPGAVPLIRFLRDLPGRNTRNSIFTNDCRMARTYQISSSSVPSICSNASEPTGNVNSQKVTTYIQGDPALVNSTCKIDVILHK